MKSRWWNIFDGMVEAAFKPVAGGYVYRAPSLLPFDSGTYYKVNQDQKEQLAGYHINMLAALFCLIIVAAGIGGPLVDAYWSGNMWTGLGIAILVGLAVGIGANGCLAKKVRPIISTLEPAHERITRGDSFKAQARAYSTPMLIALMIIYVILLLPAAAVSVTGSSNDALMGLLGVILFGGGAIYTAALYISKRKQAAV